MEERAAWLAELERKKEKSLARIAGDPEKVEEYYAFIEANPDLHFCSTLHLYQRLPAHLIPIGSAIAEHEMSFGSLYSDGAEPRGIVRGNDGESMDTAHRFFAELTAAELERARRAEVRRIFPAPARRGMQQFLKFGKGRK